MWRKLTLRYKGKKYCCQECMEIWKVRAELDDKVEALTLVLKDSANDLVEENTLDAMVIVDKPRSDPPSS
ncbi:hypothetical protein V6N13_024798 [Hibiscus sabdariffa]|uniref:Uncharacterized protein n=2 Tax=Hibiscus sabdariffa TaxID=183260 RepID=A0ABR2BU68_9ROSI